MFILERYKLTKSIHNFVSKVRFFPNWLWVLWACGKPPSRGQKEETSLFKLDSKGQQFVVVAHALRGRSFRQMY
jgi:hypothetical protein